jgi:hypothetical protein
MDFKKLIMACMVPTILLLVLKVLDIVMSTAFEKIASLLCLSGVGFFVLELLAQLYAGYAATKMHKLGIPGAIVVSTLSALLSTVISQIILVVLVLAMLLPPHALNPLGAQGISTLDWFGFVISSLIMLVIDFAAGIILGAIGGFIGQRM